MTDMYVVPENSANDIVTAIRAAAKAAQLISPNADAALQKAMHADSMAALSNEFRVTASGTTYAGQLACSLDGTAEVVYYCPDEHWDQIQKIPMFEPVHTYYVDAAHGLDSNTGTSEATPWKTIAKVNATKFEPGDRILFKRGQTWRGEQLYVSSSGTADVPIIFGSYGTGANPLIDPTLRFTDWTVYSGKVWKHKFDKDPYQVFEDNVRLTRASSMALSPGQWYYEVGRAIYVRCTDDSNPNMHVVEHRAIGYPTMAWSFNSQAYVSVKGIDITRGDRGYSWEFDANGAASHQSHDITIEDCTVSWCATRGFAMGEYADLALSNISISNCTVHDCNGEGFWIGNGQNIKVIDCEIYNGRKEHAKFWDTSSGGGIISGIRSKDTLIKGCYVHDIYNSSCIVVEHEPNYTCPANVTIDSNHLVVSRDGDFYGIMDAGNNSRIINNWIERSSGGGSGISLVNNSNGAKVYHNTIMTTATHGWGLYIESGTNVIFKNNIICSNVTNAAIGIANGTGTGMTMDYNDYYGLSISFRYSDGSYSTKIAQWCMKTGQEAHSLSSNPKFVTDYSDLHLQTSSPCKNAGVDVGVAYDHDGRPRPHGTAMPTIGAYE